MEEVLIQTFQFLNALMNIYLIPKQTHFPDIPTTLGDISLWLDLIV